jgi:hypothetical protein
MIQSQTFDDILLLNFFTQGFDEEYRPYPLQRHDQKHWEILA